MYSNDNLSNFTSFLIVITKCQLIAHKCKTEIENMANLQQNHHLWNTRVVQYNKSDDKKTTFIHLQFSLKVIRIVYEPIRLKL